MKHCFIATLMLLCLGTISATAQISQADTMSIEAISDTTNVIEETLDSAYGGGYYSIPDIFGTDLETLPFKMILPLIIVGLIFLFLPLVVLLLLLYLIYRNSKQKDGVNGRYDKVGQTNSQFYAPHNTSTTRVALEERHNEGFDRPWHCRFLLDSRC